MDQFLRDGTNKRTDAYGGSIENRMRFLLEVVDAVSAAAWCPAHRGLRISPAKSDNEIADSNPQSLFNRVAALSGKGLAYLHVIEGDTGGAAVPPFDYHVGDQTSLRRAPHGQ